MPTMSSLRSKPSFTPDTMLAIRARVRPWSARILRSSSGRPMTSTPPSSVAEAVLEVDAEHVLLLVLEHAEVLDEALLLQQLRDADLELAGGDVALLVLGPAGVPDAREEVGDGIAAHVYQLAFVMPGTSPLRASSRKHRRHIWNLRMKARGRPHSLQRW